MTTKRVIKAERKSSNIQKRGKGGKGRRGAKPFLLFLLFFLCSSSKHVNQT
jgi:hypothetical protein